MVQDRSELCLRHCLQVLIVSFMLAAVFAAQSLLGSRSVGSGSVGVYTAGVQPGSAASQWIWQHRDWDDFQWLYYFHILLCELRVYFSQTSWNDKSSVLHKRHTWIQEVCSCILCLIQKIAVRIFPFLTCCEFILYVFMRLKVKMRCRTLRALEQSCFMGWNRLELTG